MLGSFSSEWIKLRRRSMLVWGLGGMLFFSAIATFFTLQRAVKFVQPGFHGHGFRITVAELSQPNGLVHGIVDVSSLFGVVALALFAGATATEYSLGTLRNLLVRQPARIKLLCGKFLALALFVLIALVLAFAVAAAIAFAVGPGKGVDTSAWTSSTGLNDTLQALFHVYLTTLGYGVLGTALAVVLRSPAVAITLGIAYALPGEAIIVNALWSNGDRWLPGQLLDAVAHGGNSSSSYSRALLIVVIYAVIAAAGTLALFQRRDA
jgi:ABC-type transport system involved in multi-copper enzyme maturation permease subunit